MLNTSPYSTRPAKPFEIETDSPNYVISIVLTQHGHLVDYHSETLSDVVHRYPT
jgi:hypothetical protein